MIITDLSTHTHFHEITSSLCLNIPRAQSAIA